jgi:hypothetical protein
MPPVAAEFTIRRNGRDVYRAAKAATPIAKTLPRPAANWDTAPVNCAGVLVVTVPLVLAVAVAEGDLVQLQSVV